MTQPKNLMVITKVKDGNKIIYTVHNLKEEWLGDITFSINLKEWEFHSETNYAYRLLHLKQLDGFIDKLNKTKKDNLKW